MSPRDFDILRGFPTPFPMPDSLSSTLDLLPPPAFVDVFIRAKPIPWSPDIFFKHATVTASLAIYIYDYICTLDREVAYVWSRPRSIGTYLFVLNRYLPFVDLTLSLHALKVMLSPEACHRQYSLITWLNTAGIQITQGILVLRTIAIWERNRWICAILAVVITGTITTSIVTSQLYLNSLHFVEENPDFFFGCVLTSANRSIIISFIAVLVSETTIVVLTAIRAVAHLRQSSSSWVHHLYKRGFLFYIYLLILTLLNLLYPIFADPSLKTIFTDPQRALHSMLCNRVIFIIFSVQHEEDKRHASRIAPARLSRRQAESESDIVLSTILDTFATIPDDRASLAAGENKDGTEARIDHQRTLNSDIQE